MKYFILYLPLAIIYLSFKTTIGAGLPLPDITLIIVFFAACEKASIEGVSLAFVLGYIDDVFMGSVIGSSSFALVSVFALTHLALRWVEFSGGAARAAATFFLSLFKGTLTWVLLTSNGFDIGFLPMAPVSITTGLFAPLLIVLFQKITPFRVSGIEKREV